MRLLPARGRAPVAWRNGGGVTCEVAAWPERAHAFDWRVSIATLSGSGPYSAFAGVDRTQLILAGGPVRLAGDGWTAAIGPDDPPFAFDGGDAVTATTAHPATGLNVMSRRGIVRHALSRPAGAIELSAGAGMLLLLAARAGPRVGGVALALHDAVLVEPGSAVALDAARHAIVAIRFAAALRR